MSDAKFKVGDAVLFTPKTTGIPEQRLTIAAVYFSSRDFDGRQSSDGAQYVGYVYGVSESEDLIVETSLSLAGGRNAS